MTRTALRLLAATVAACVALLLGAAPAFAHTRLESSNPADKSSVDAAPESVSLTFNEDISAEFATMSVVGPDGTNYQSGQVSAAGGQVSTAVSPLGPGRGLPDRLPRGLRRRAPRAGQGVVHADHAGPAAAAAHDGPRGGGPHRAARGHAAVAPQASSTPSGGAPIWPWLVGAVILVAAGAVVALRLGRRS